MHPGEHNPLYAGECLPYSVRVCVFSMMWNGWLEYFGFQTTHTVTFSSLKQLALSRACWEEECEVRRKACTVHLHPEVVMFVFMHSCTTFGVLLDNLPHHSLIVPEGLS